MAIVALAIVSPTVASFLALQQSAWRTESGWAGTAVDVPVPAEKLRTSYRCLLPPYAVQC